MLTNLPANLKPRERLPALSVIVAALLAVSLTAGGCGRDSLASASDEATSSTRLVVGVRADSMATPEQATVDHLQLHPGSDPNAPCTCDSDRSGNGWCRRCNVGHVAGQRIESPTLFEGIDPHGHQLDNECLQLQVCREVIRTDGYCDAVGIGFVNGNAYFTRLTYLLARGEPLDAGCQSCNALVGQAGWCQSCGRGVIGNVAFADRTLFEHAEAEHKRLLRGIALASTCDMCAMAAVAHRTCPKCQISYETDCN
jgi:hypothetical protein